MIKVIDTETTDLNGYVCQVGILDTDDDLEVIDTFECLINPLSPISPSASGIHFIRDEHIVDKVTIDKVIDRIIPSENDIYVVGHNLPFDISMVNTSYAYTKDTLNGSVSGSEDVLDLFEGYPTIDTLKLAKELYTKDSGDFKLGTLYHRFGLYTEVEELLEKHNVSGGAHSALFDVLMTYSLLKFIMKDKDLSLEGCYNIVHKKIEHTTCTMKKYRYNNPPVTWEWVLENDRSYCEWLVANPQYIKDEVKEYLENNL